MEQQHQTLDIEVGGVLKNFYLLSSHYTRTHTESEITSSSAAGAQLTKEIVSSQLDAQP